MLRFLQALLGWPASDGVGATGERWAAEWLKRERRFSVVAKNWRNPRDLREEIDLVCRDGEVLVFVEVKARAAGALVPGYFAVNARKRRVVLRAARSYLSRLPEPPRTFRFDVVEITLPPKSRPPAEVNPAPASGPVIRHFENVPLFPRYFRGH